MRTALSRTTLKDGPSYETFALTRVRRVLVVEDDLELMTVLDQIIRTIDAAIATEWVTTAEEAVSLLEDKLDISPHAPYDLVLADIFLEGDSTGLDLWKLCQQHFPEMPVIVTSALPVDKFFTALGRDTISPPYLAKPFRPGECRQLLEGILRYSEAKKNGGEEYDA